MTIAAAVLVAAAVGALPAGISRADVMLYTPERWSSPGLQGWTNTMPDVTLANNNNFLLITFLDQGDPPVGAPGDDIYTFSAPATNMFVGGYPTNGNFAVLFNFLASNVAPASVSVVFGVATNAHEWAFPLAIPTVGVWTPYSVWFNYVWGWTCPGATESDFLADLQAVSYIGIHIDRGSAAEQYYGLDDFELIPEPAELLLLAAALAGLFFVRRRRQRPPACPA